MSLRELVFEKAAPVLETSGQTLRGVCECTAIVEDVGPDTICPKCDLVRWACLRIETTGGPLYVATDAARATFQREGRTVIAETPFGHALSALAAKTPFDRHLWLKAYIK